MTTRVRDYSKGLIYKIECNDPSITECYYGSTINFRNRKNQHKTDCCNDKRKGFNCKVYKFIREHGGWDNWSMVLVEYYPCNTKLELEQHERKFVIANIGGLNKKSPAPSNDELKKYQKQYQKQWSEANKDYVNEYHKKYYEENKDRKREYDKQYYKANKDRIREKSKKYRESKKKNN